MSYEKKKRKDDGLILSVPALMVMPVAFNGTSLIIEPAVIVFKTDKNMYYPLAKAKYFIHS
jgi:hypothetical protein